MRLRHAAEKSRAVARETNAEPRLLETSRAKVSITYLLQHAWCWERMQCPMRFLLAQDATVAIITTFAPLSS